MVTFKKKREKYVPISRFNITFVLEARRDSNPHLTIDILSALSIELRA